MKKLTFAFILFALALAPAAVFAWDFSCSPKQTTEISRVDIPNIMFMLDKSGSMSGGDRTRTCRVCQESSGDFVEVSGADDCPVSGTPWDRTQTATVPRNRRVNGYSYNMWFTSLPAATLPVKLDVSLRGDFNGRCEWASVYIDGTYAGRINPNYGQCNTDHKQTFDVPASALADGKINVRIQTTADRNSCGSDGVDAFCSTNRAIVTVRQSTAIYWGSQTWVDPCGTEDKWDQAVAALSRITYESSNLDPDLAAFGLATYSRSTANILVDCKPDNYSQIVAALGTQSPGGATPTGLAIDVARQSDCVSGSQYLNISQVESVPKDSSNSGFDFTYRFDNVPPQTQDFNLKLGLVGDYNGTCEFADLYVDGDYFGRYRPRTGVSCNSTPAEKVFTIPASYLDDGVLNVVVDNRGRNDATTNPTCSAGTDGTNAHCGTNKGIVTLQLAPDVVRAAATILVTDGAPNGGYQGLGSVAAAVQQACIHRDTANLYVVGLGSGTDEDVNNIVAAAGGTGTCTVNGTNVDPCSDVSNWSNLRGRCVGSFQTDGQAALMSAIAAITAELQCLYDVNFQNSGTTNVPTDPANDYQYLFVEANWIASGPTPIYNKDSPSSIPPGEGWEFNNPSTRQRVRFTPYYCDQVNMNRISQVSTQLACLCQETAGNGCDVPNYTTLNTCPKGVWACQEGVDFCQPDANCCVAGLDCETELLGVCKNGKTACNGATQTCEQTVFPSVEVCNGLDDDCDGIVDNISGVSCTGSGGLGRCAPGITACDAAGNPICIPKLQPQPELCNGIDDDCNGMTDDIAESWQDPQFTSIVPPVTGPLCNYKNSCTCPSGAKDAIAGSGFDEYFAAWNPVCVCGEGLADSGEFSPAPAADSAGDTGPHGCSSTGQSADASWLALLALLGFFRRRR